MKKIFFLFVIFLLGCSDTPTHTPKRYTVPDRVIAVQVTVREDDTRYDCIHRGGIWVTGDSFNRINELVGCIESEEKK